MLRPKKIRNSINNHGLCFTSSSFCSSSTQQWNDFKTESSSLLIKRYCFPYMASAFCLFSSSQAPLSRKCAIGEFMIDQLESASTWSTLIDAKGSVRGEAFRSDKSNVPVKSSSDQRLSECVRHLCFIELKRVSVQVPTTEAFVQYQLPSFFLHKSSNNCDKRKWPLFWQSF